MANSINMTSKRADGEKVTKTLTHVNPNATDANVAIFAASLAKLSDNTLTALERADAEDLYEGEVASDHIFVNIDSDIATLTATGGNDLILNSAGSILVSASSGDDTITNSGDNVSLDGGYGDDSISNTGDNVSLDGGYGDDSISNTGDSVTIYTGYGDNTIQNTGDSVTITGSLGDDSISNTSDNVSIFGSPLIYLDVIRDKTGNLNDNTGNDTITNSGDSVAIYAGSGNDSIFNEGNNVTVSFGDGDNTIQNTGTANQYRFEGTSGTQVISGFKESDTLVFGVVEPDNSIQTAAGLEFVTDNATVSLPGVDFVPNVEITRKQYIASSSNEYITVAGGGGQLVKGTNAAKDLTVSGGVFGGVNAGSGVDKIYMTETAKNKKYSIQGARGNDHIFVNGNGGNYYIYNNGDGKDSVYGWTESDTLIVTSGYSTMMSTDGNHFYVKVTTGWVEFTDVQPGDIVNIQDSDGTIVQHTIQRLMQGTTSSKNIYNLSTNELYRGGTSAADAWAIDAGNGNDSIYNDQNFVSIFGGSGNDQIYIYANALTSEVTRGVSIQPGPGNDSIDVISDCQVVETASDTVTVYGAHVYEIGANDSLCTIYGYNSGDSIYLIPPTTLTGATVGTTYITIKAGGATVYLNQSSRRGETYTIVENGVATTYTVQGGE